MGSEMCIRDRSNACKSDVNFQAIVSRRARDSAKSLMLNVLNLFINSISVLKVKAFSEPIVLKI